MSDKLRPELADRAGSVANVHPDLEPWTREDDRPAALVDGDADLGARGGRQPAAHGDQVAVPPQHLAVNGLVDLLPAQLGPLECSGVLRVRDRLGPPAEGGEVAPATLRDGPPERG